MGSPDSGQRPEENLRYKWSVREPTEATQRRIMWWTMAAVLIVVLINLAQSVHAHGMLVQKVDDLAGQVAALQQLVFSHMILAPH